MRLFRGSVSCGRGASDCVDFDLFNFQKLSHAQNSEGQEKRHNRPPFNLKSFKFRRLWKTAVLLHFSVVYICNIIHLHNRKLYNSIFSDFDGWKGWRLGARGWRKRMIQFLLWNSGNQNLWTSTITIPTRNGVCVCVCHCVFVCVRRTPCSSSNSAGRCRDVLSSWFSSARITSSNIHTQ